MSARGIDPATSRRVFTHENGDVKAESAERRILVVDDEAQHLKWLGSLLEEMGYSITIAEDGHQACKMLVSRLYNAVITDLNMPGKNGIEVVQRMKRVQPDCLGIVITGFGSIEGSVKAIRAGAYDFIPKPVHPQKILEVIEEGLRFQSLRARQHVTGASEGLIVGCSPKMLQVRELIEKVAASDSTVLITGESGTGKEVAAKTIHQLSPRISKPFVVVHCGAMPETLLESELFGHEKGAFTGAHQTRTGRFEMAHGGTIFLDEVGDIPLHLQLKLLRVLQERKFERVGGAKTISSDFRVVAATNRDLQKEVVECRFRMDLYYRLNVIPIHLPPLRDRGQDIQTLAQYFLDFFNQNKLGAVEGFSPETAKFLLGYPWPGNVRELKNLLERLVVLKGSGIITPDDLPESFHTLRGAESLTIPSIPDEGISLNSLMEEFESRLIFQALEKSNGVKSKAAQLLNVKRTTLVEKMKKLGPEFSTFEARSSQPSTETSKLPR